MNPPHLLCQVILRKYREESASKVDKWFERDASLLTSLGASLGAAMTAPDRDNASIVSAGSVKKMLSGIWNRITQPDSKESAGGGGQRQRQQQLQREFVVGIETNNIRAPVLPSEELVKMWREEILPQFHDRIKMRWVQDLVYKGLPRAVRGEVWMCMVGNKLKLDEAKYRGMLRTCQQVGDA